LTSESASAVRVSAVCLTAHLIFVAAVLATHHGDPSWFVRFGVDAPMTRLGRQLLGEVVTHPGVGADGQYFWVLARDPFLLHPQETAAWLDQPVYRAQRVAYPAFAAPWRVLGERGVLWGLLLENLAIIAIGSYLTARLAVSLGLPARTGLAFAFNPGVIFAGMFDLCDALALAATVGAVYAAVSRRRVALALYSVLAGLAKEPALLALGATAFVTGFGAKEVRPPVDRWTRMLLVVPGGIAAGVWAVYIRLRLERPSNYVDNFSLPFVGFVRAWRTRWVVEGLVVETLVAVALLVAASAVVVLFARRRTLLLAAALPYALLVPFFGVPVILFTNNALRAFAPAFTFLWLEIYRRTPKVSKAVGKSPLPPRKDSEPT
jgi:hypothetical protein